MSMLDEIGDYLQSHGVGTLATDLFLRSRPDYPDKLLCVYAYPGRAPEYVQDSYMPIFEKPQIQVVARAAKAEEAEELAWRAWAVLAPVTNATLGSTRYRSIRPDGSPGLMSRDTNDRILYFFNAAVDKEVTVAIPS